MHISNVMVYAGWWARSIICGLENVKESEREIMKRKLNKIVKYELHYK